MQKTIFNGNGEKKNIVISGSIVFTLLTTVLLALGGWGLVKLTTISDSFATKTMVLNLHQQVAKSVECVGNEAKENDSKIETRLEKRIDRLEDTLTANFTHIQESLEKLVYEGRRSEVKGH